LNLIKQGVTWYKDLSNGDPSFDYDFMILPIRSVNITPGFNFNANNLTVSFTNTSTNASTYSWNFGDGGTANTANPSHNYPSSGTYQVKLVVGGPAGSGCADSITQSVVVTNTAIGEISNWFENPTYESSTNQISFQSLANQTCFVYSAEGKLLDEFKVAKNETVKRTIPSSKSGMYLLKSSMSNQSFRFIINGYSK
jgi:xanthomonalisin